MELSMRLPQASPLYKPEVGETIDLPMDDSIAPFVLTHGRWQAEELQFIRAHLPLRSAVLIDVGANIGLVTRQLMHQLPSIVAAVCFEPHPRNFRLLTRNLGHLPQCYLVHAAVGGTEGMLEFYEEASNAGNYSLNLDAMRGKEFRTSTVRCMSATAENLLGSLPPELRDGPIVWKSDTQGFDELIVTSLSDEFWSRVHCGVMEIWRIAKPTFDRSRLATILAMFPVLRFSEDMQKNLSANDVLEFATGDDYQHRDLFFARG
jgi:FkbM family methyltransferase